MQPELVSCLGDAIPGDHARQVTAEDLLRDLAPSGRVLDLGCGDGRAVSLIEGVGAQYVGVDIADSPEVHSRRALDDRFHTFDGVNLPFPDGMFDVVYSKQVLEHVRQPEALLRGVARVLRPGGAFVGSVSFLEPYHSFSIFNWSPYGIYTVFRDAGLTVKALRPGVDGATLVLRTSTGRRSWFDRYFTRPSPLHGFIEMRAKRQGWDIRRMNAEKLAVSGQITFHAERL